ncbi:MAG: HEAT repeat domain-containing protein, partial [Planctomycetota bacterium]
AALGAMGTESCHSILHDLHKAGGHRQPLAARALLRYADNAPADRAALVYRTVMLDEAPRAIRAASLAGLARVAPRDCFDHIGPILRGERAPDLRPFAFGLVREFNDAALVAEIAEQFTTFDESGQVLLLGVIADRDDASLRPAVHRALESQEVSVRFAALRALSKIGTVEDVGILARSAANARGRAGDVARAALAGLSGDGIDAAILRGFEQEKDAAVRAELLRAAAVRRRGTPASSELERYIRPTLRLDDVTLRLAAIEAATLVEPFIWNDLAQLLELELHPRVRRAAEDALIGDAKRSPDRWNEVFSFFQGRVPRSSQPAKMSLARILGEVQNRGALALLTSLVSSERSSLNVSSAALRAVGRWRTRDALPLLRSVAESNSESVTRGQRRLARRGYLRILREDRGSDSETLDALRPVLTEELSADDRRLALSVVGDLASPEALAIARGYLDDAEVTGEAVQACMDIAARLAATDPELARNVLAQLAGRELSESQTQRLTETRARLEQHRAYLGSWEYAGPYQKDNATAPALVDISFAPETNPESVRWRPLRIGGNPWILDFTKLDSGSNRAVYLRTTIALAKAGSPVFAIGSDDGVKIWVDDKVVHENPSNRPHVAGQDRVPVALDAGHHNILVKVTQGGGGWAFSLQLVDDQGAPFEGVTTVAPSNQ